jgi:glycosyltransferase involved in cell wall biosynthesis
MALKKEISLIYWASGSGIARDIQILEQALEGCGFRVHHIRTRNRKSKRERIWRFLLQLPRLLFKRRLQLHVEQIHREQFRFSRTNIIVPNPELTDRDLFRKITKPLIVFGKSHRAVGLFRAIGLETHYTGFTSGDHFDRKYPKDYRRFLHVAGASNFKGTDVVVKAWSRHPEWPLLTVVRTLKDCYGNPRPSLTGMGNVEIIENWIPEEGLRELQNACGIHLCPSEMEGFGHYIMEGLSVGSVIVTTNAAPMNELVPDSFGYCAAAVKTGQSYMEDRWRVDPAAFEECIKQILDTPELDLARMGESGRKHYEKLDQSFRENFRQALERVWAQACKRG